MIEDRNDTSDTDYGKYGSKSDSYEMTGKDQAYYNREGDIAYVEAVFCKTNAFVNGIRNGLYNTITGIRDDTHVKGKGGTDSG